MYDQPFPTVRRLYNDMLTGTGEWVQHAKWKRGIVDNCARLAIEARKEIEIMTNTEDSPAMAWAKVEFHRHATLFPLLKRTWAMLPGHPLERPELLEWSHILSTMAWYGDRLSDNRKGGHELNQVANHMAEIEIAARDKSIKSMRDLISFSRANPFAPENIRDIYGPKVPARSPAQKTVDQRTPA
jgi:hypothetical protein